MEWEAFQLHMPMSSQTVSWAKSPKGNWYSFKWISMKQLGLQRGIYIIWYPEIDDWPLRVAYVGQGIVRNRIFHHLCRFSRILDKLERVEHLRLTWTLVPDQTDRDGIERYLAEVLLPEVGETWPEALAIKVNLPDW